MQIKYDKLGTNQLWLFVTTQFIQSSGNSAETPRKVWVRAFIAKRVFNAGLRVLL